jgi:two-component system NarL family sensor kinase
LLDELGLVSALRHYVDGFAANSNIKVDLEISPDFGRLADGMELACFRIVQEGLTNIHRHSKSATAAITIRYEGRRVLVEVRDAGRGIPLERLPELESGGGAGFAGMRERITQLGGTLEIKSDAKGTVVIAILPLKHAITALMRTSKGAGLVVVPANIGNQVGG